jgi:hypothetical protein
MNHLFANAPLFVPTSNMADYETHDIERRVEEAERKQNITETHDAKKDLNA